MKLPINFFKRNINTVVLFLSLLLSISIMVPLVKDKPEVLSSTEEMLNVDINIQPPLDFSLFSAYSFTASQLPDTPSNVKLNLSVDMGDGNECWDFYADGTCNSQPMSFNMTYDSGTNSYQKNIYPDQIYPEIYFAPSSITWGNQPLDTPVRRNDYHILHLNNTFEMVSEMSVWVEFNTAPSSVVNSADLQVYLVEKGHDITYFNSDWRNNTGVELIGTIGKDAIFNHTHSMNSSHHLIRLVTDSNGMVGNKALDISGDFWIVLYSNSPNNARGWNLRYQPDSLCNTNNLWYRGNITGWSTTAQSGCPDTHIHISRRNIQYTDTVEAYISATYDTGTFNSPVEIFSFVELPNLPPNPTSFTTPTVGSRYSGDLNIEWDPATDPNIGDTLTYNIYITPVGGTQSTLVQNTSDTSYLLNTNLYDDDEYTLQATVCDQENLCSNFALDGSFYIDNIIIPETISSVSISSTNINSGWAKDGDTVTISFETTDTIPTPTVEIYSGGNHVSNTILISNPSGNIWNASYEVENTDSSGQVTFVISSTLLDRVYFETTDSSNIVVDVTPPPSPVSSLSSGEYLDEQEVSLSSESGSTIRYSLDGTDVNCNTGLIYDSPILISESLTLKAVSCDLLENMSSVSTYSYSIKYSLSSISIFSSNSNSQYAKELDTVSLQFTSTNTIDTPTVIFSVDSQPILDEVSIQNIEGNIWIASFNVLEDTPNGLISFEISSTSLYTGFTESTDLSRVTIDTQPPLTPISNISSGTYTVAQSVILTSSLNSSIHFTLDGSTPNCLSGNVYLIPLLISSSTTIKSISCDLAGNISSVSTLSYTIFPDTVNIPNEIGTDSQESTSESEESVDQEIEDESNEIVDQKEDGTITYSGKVTQKDGEEVISVLKIRVLDPELNPLIYTEVTIYSSPQRSRTDLNGIATFYDIPLGEHTIVYSYDGEQQREEIQLGDGLKEGLYTFESVDIITKGKGSLPIYAYILILISIVVTYFLSKRLIEKRGERV